MEKGDPGERRKSRCVGDSENGCLRRGEKR